MQYEFTGGSPPTPEDAPSGPGTAKTERVPTAYEFKATGSGAPKPKKPKKPKKHEHKSKSEAPDDPPKKSRRSRSKTRGFFAGLGDRLRETFRVQRKQYNKVALRQANLDPGYNLVYHDWVAHILQLHLLFAGGWFIARFVLLWLLAGTKILCLLIGHSDAVSNLMGAYGRRRDAIRWLGLLLIPVFSFAVHLTQRAYLTHMEELGREYVKRFRGKRKKYKTEIVDEGLSAALPWAHPGAWLSGDAWNATVNFRWMRYVHFALISTLISCLILFFLYARPSWDVWCCYEDRSDDAFRYKCSDASVNSLPDINHKLCKDPLLKRTGDYIALFLGMIVSGVLAAASWIVSVATMPFHYKKEMMHVYDEVLGDKNKKHAS